MPSVEYFPPPMFGANESDDPVDVEKYYSSYNQQRGINEEFWNFHVEKHLSGAAKQWWEYRHSSINTWGELKEVFLRYHEGLVTRDYLRRELDLKVLKDS